MRRKIEEQLKNPRASIKIGCLPLIVALIVLATLKIVGELSASWTMIFLTAIGLYWIYVMLVVVVWLVMMVFLFKNPYL